MSGRRRFLKVAVESLADNAELQLAGRQQLEAQLSPEAAEAELEAAAERLEKSGTGRWHRVWAAVVLVASLPMLAGPVRKVVAAYTEARSIVSPVMMIHAKEPRFAFRESLREADRLLLFGDESVPDGAERWRVLWRSDPENPRYFVEYALAYGSEHEALPPDFLETGARIDPGNGWYALHAAALGAKDVVERDSLGWKDRRAGKRATWTVKDEAELARRVALFKQATGAERIESHQAKLMEERFAKLPEAGELIEAIPVLGYLANARIAMTERYLADLIAVEAQRCRREGDREGFVELAAAWQVYYNARLNEINTLVGCLILNAGMRATLPEMSGAAAVLGVEPERWKRRVEASEARKERIDAAREEEGGIEELVLRHGSMLAAMSLPMISRQVEDPPELTREDLRPAARVEEALLGRMLAAAGWLVLGLFGIVSLVAGVMQALLTRRLAKRLRGLFDRRDACWIGVGGLLGPLVIYLGLRYGTPLSRLDFGGKSTLYLPSLAHFVGLLLMWMVWPVAIAQWRAARAGRVLGWKRPGWWAVSAMVAPLAGMACFGLAMPAWPGSVPLIVAGQAFGAWSLVWWLAQGWAGAFGKVEDRVRRGVIARAARPAWLGAMLAMVALAFHFHSEERRWYARDEVMRVGPGFTAYEVEVTARLQAELRQVVE